MASTLVTFIYPDVCRFLPEWVESVNAQDADGLDVVVFADGVPGAESHFRDLIFPLRTVDLAGTIVRNRLTALEWLAENASAHIIFQDADDLMTANRVSASARFLEHFDLVANDLSTLDASGTLLQESVWAGRLPDGYVFTANFLRRWNIAGLGNTAIRRSLLATPVQETGLPLVAADWFIFYQLMASGATGVFTSECRTLYRQHDANLAGIGAYSEASVAKAIAVKKAHYAALTAAGFDFKREIADIYDRETKPKIHPDRPPGALFWWEDTEL